MNLLLNRLAALALLLGVLVLAWYAVAEPLRREFLEDRQVIAEHRDQIGRFEAIAGRLSHYQDELRRQRRNPELSRAIWHADSDTLAAADLQQRVKSLVEGQGGALVSTQVLEPIQERPFTRIRINVRMLLSVPVLQQVLYEVESQMPYLVVRQLLVTQRNWRGRRLPRQKLQSDNLDVRMEISGYWFPRDRLSGAG